MIDLATIQKAHERIKPYIHRTPVFTCDSLNTLSDCSLYFKCENFQKVGAFKIRGAMNAVKSLTAEALQNGVATHSSGNHAQAIAYAARMAGSRAFIVMPENSPRVKIDAVRSYGAHIRFCAPNQQARENAVQEIIAETGATFIHPYNDERVIAGQASCAKELLEDVPGLDMLIAPVGGGGLLSGTALIAHHTHPEIRVFAGEPEGAADAIRSLRSGKIEKAPYINTIADGLLTTLGDLTFPIIQKYVSDIFTVSDTEIIQSMKWVYERMKMVVEPSCAVPLAAVLKNRNVFSGHRVGILVSGGNVDLLKLSGLFEKLEAKN